MTKPCIRMTVSGNTFTLDEAQFNDEISRLIGVPYVNYPSGERVFHFIGINFHSIAQRIILAGYAVYVQYKK